jgi:hypothetical protein
MSNDTMHMDANITPEYLVRLTQIAPLVVLWTLIWVKLPDDTRAPDML